MTENKNIEVTWKIYSDTTAVIPTTSLAVSQTTTGFLAIENMFTNINPSNPVPVQVQYAPMSSQI